MGYRLEALYADSIQPRAGQRLELDCRYRSCPTPILLLLRKMREGCRSDRGLEGGRRDIAPQGRL